MEEPVLRDELVHVRADDELLEASATLVKRLQRGRVDSRRGSPGGVPLEQCTQLVHVLQVGELVRADGGATVG